jgi:hypothetical protein
MFAQEHFPRPYSGLYLLSRLEGSRGKMRTLFLSAFLLLIAHVSSSLNALLELTSFDDSYLNCLFCGVLNKNDAELSTVCVYSVAGLSGAYSSSPHFIVDTQV